MKKQEETKTKQKGKLLYIVLIILLVLVVLFESFALLFTLFVTNGKRFIISGHEWINSYTYGSEKYKVAFKFDKNNKFKYGVYKNDKLDESSAIEGKYTVVNDKVIIEYKTQDEEMATILYIGKDYLCTSFKTCEDETKYYDSKDKRALEYKKYNSTGDETNTNTEPEEEDESYLKNKPVYKKVAEPTIYIFHGDGCPHCADLLNWIKTYKYKKSYNVVKYEVWKDQDNQKLMNKVAKYLNEEAHGVPFIVIGDQIVAGFSEDMTPEEIEKALDKAYSNIDKNKYYDVVETVQK